MKKILLVLMPIAVVLALFSYYIGKNLNWSTLLNGLNTINFTEFDYSSISEAFDKLNLVNNLSVFSDIWSNVDGLLSFFSAIGQSFTALFDLIVNIFTSIYYVIKFIYEFGSYFIYNSFEFIKFLFNYIFS